METARVTRGKGTIKPSSVGTQRQERDTGSVWMVEGQRCYHPECCSLSEYSLGIGGRGSLGLRP